MKFMALGGIDQIGASCYYLELAGQKFLLDCGKQGSGQKMIHPDFFALRQQALFSFSELDAILISHGHCDHAGLLPDLRPWEYGVPVYATSITRTLLKSLLVDRLTYQTGMTAEKQLRQMIQSENFIQFLAPVTYGVPFQKGDVTITYYPAGHIPGAAMIYLESPEGNVLYTGDFCMERTQLTDGLLLPEKVQPDVMILCGLHARHPLYRPINTLLKNESKIRACLQDGNPVHLRATQLTKGLETAYWAANTFLQTKIYLDQNTWDLGEQLESAHLHSMAQSFYHKTSVPPKEGIIIDGVPLQAGAENFSVNISLHATYPDYVSLLEKLHPKKVFLVHSPPDTHFTNGNNALADRFFPSISLTIPTQGQLYKID